MSLGEIAAGASGAVPDAVPVRADLDAEAQLELEQRQVAAPEALDPSAPADQTPGGRFVDRIEAMSGGPDVSTRGEGAVAVGTLGGSGETAEGMRGVGGSEAAAPSYRELMQNFHNATTHAMEINLLGSAGTSMAGSMSKLMSGN